MAGFIGTGVGIGVGALQTVIGLFQKRKLKEPKAPRKSVSPKIGQMIDIYRSAASQQKMPGQDVTEQKQAGAISSGISNIQKVSGGGGSAAQAIANMYTGQMSMLNDLTASAAKWREQNKSAYANALMKGAAAEDEAWKYNKLLPYQRAVQKYDEAMATANKNISAGLSNIAGTAAMAGGGGQTFGDVYGSPAAGMGTAKSLGTSSALLSNPSLSTGLMGM